VIATPVRSHYELGRAALEAGLLRSPRLELRPRRAAGRRARPPPRIPAPRGLPQQLLLPLQVPSPSQSPIINLGFAHPSLHILSLKNRPPASQNASGTRSRSPPRAQYQSGFGPH